MSGGAEMIKKLAIGLACALASWSSAEACSPPPPGYWKSLNLYSNLSASYRNTDGYVNPSATSDKMKTYLRISPLERLIDNAQVIFVGSTKFYSSGTIPNDAERSYVIAKFKVKHTLKGKKSKDYAYATTDDGIIPILNVKKASKEVKDNFKTFQQNERIKIESHSNPRFWDFSQLNNLKSYDELNRGTSCGSESIPMLTEKQRYLVIATQQNLIVEPIENENDALVIAIKKRLSAPFVRIGPSISMSDFIGSMERVKLLETKTCSSTKSVGNLAVKKTFKSKTNEKLFQTTYSQMLNEYFSQTRKEHNCRIGQEYLLYGHNDIPQTLSASWDEETLGYRFARVDNRGVLVSDITTHLILKDEPLSIADLSQANP